jgi:hypothetical protein
VELYRDGTWMLADDRVETIAGSGGPLSVTTFCRGVPWRNGCSRRGAW